MATTAAENDKPAALPVAVSPFVFRLIRILLLVYIGFALMLAGCQRSLIYQPSRHSEPDALLDARSRGLEPWRSRDGDLIGWKAPGTTSGRDALLVFHGNAGHAAHREYFVQGFSPFFDVYLLEYPGYGARPGRPSESHLVAAAREAMLQLKAETPGRLVVVGESLGTGVACRLASLHPEAIDGVLLCTPFTRLADVARHHYPFFPVGVFLRDRFDSAQHLRTYTGPVAFLIAERDEVVPARLGQRLHDAYAGPKRLWIQPGRSHNTLDLNPRSSWWGEVAAFLAPASP